MRQTTLAVFAIVAIAAMMGAASVAPAYAAPKDAVTKDVDKTTVEPKTGVQRECGTEYLAFNEIRTTKGKIWSNGHFKMSVSWEKEFFAITDVNQEVLLATASSSTTEQGQFDGDTIRIVQDKSKVTCLNGGESSKTHYVYTLSRSGNISVQST